MPDLDHSVRTPFAPVIRHERKAEWNALGRHPPHPIDRLIYFHTAKIRTRANQRKDKIPCTEPTTPNPNLLKDRQNTIAPQSRKRPITSHKTLNFTNKPHQSSYYFTENQPINSKTAKKSFSYSTRTPGRPVLSMQLHAASEKGNMTSQAYGYNTQRGTPTGMPLKKKKEFVVAYFMCLAVLWE